ncbi:MAG: DsrE/DsrF/DrsH-like family protein, partial [bacterium]
GGSLTFCSVQGKDACHAISEKPKPVLPYAEEPVIVENKTTGVVVELDCCGLQCPGPVKKMKDGMDRLNPGDQLKVAATDPGFATDAPAWCLKNGHEILSLRKQAGRIEVVIRKGEPRARVAVSPSGGKDKKTFVIFSGDLDKVMAGFVMANGALAMGSEVTLFFTFWGINALRKPGPQATGKGLLDKMFGWMMPKGPDALTLSKMHMAGMGTAMMKYVMKQKQVESLPVLMAAARAGGAKLVCCTMSMDVMGIKQDELIDGIELGGVAAFLGEADESNVTLFI